MGQAQQAAADRPARPLPLPCSADTWAPPALTPAVTRADSTSVPDAAPSALTRRPRHKSPLDVRAPLNPRPPPPLGVSPPPTSFGRRHHYRAQEGPPPPLRGTGRRSKETRPLPASHRARRRPQLRRRSPVDAVPSPTVVGTAVSLRSGKICSGKQIGRASCRERVLRLV